MKFNYKKLIDNFITLLIILYFLLYIAEDYFVVDATVTTYAAFFVSILAFVITVLSHYKRGVMGGEFCFYIFILSMHALSISNNQNISFGSLVLVLKHFFVAMVLVRIKLNRIMVKVVCCFLCVACLYLMTNETIVGLFAFGVSQNVISMHLILFLSLLLISSNKNDGLICFIATVIVLIISIWTGCRGGVIASAVIAFGVLYCNLQKTNFKKCSMILLNRIIILVGIFAAGVIYLLDKIGLDTYLYMLTRDRAEMSGNVRFIMIEEYVNVTMNSITNFFYGAPLREVEMISFYGNNPHNSYVLAHANFGLFFLALIGYLSFKNFYKYIKNKSILGFVLLGLLMRAFSDSPAFPGIYDGIIYLLIFEIPLFGGIVRWEQKYDK